MIHPIKLVDSIADVGGTVRTDGYLTLSRVRPVPARNFGHQPFGPGTILIHSMVKSTFIGGLVVGIEHDMGCAIIIHRKVVTSVSILAPRNIRLFP